MDCVPRPLTDGIGGGDSYIVRRVGTQRRNGVVMLVGQQPVLLASPWLLGIAVAGPPVIVNSLVLHREVLDRQIARVCHVPRDPDPVRFDHCRRLYLNIGRLCK